jgi:hypothetical protein
MEYCKRPATAVQQPLDQMTAYRPLRRQDVPQVESAQNEKTDDHANGIDRSWITTRPAATEDTAEAVGQPRSARKVAQQVLGARRSAWPLEVTVPQMIQGLCRLVTTCGVTTTSAARTRPGLSSLEQVGTTTMRTLLDRAPDISALVTRGFRPGCLHPFVLDQVM